VTDDQIRVGVVAGAFLVLVFIFVVRSLG